MFKKSTVPERKPFSFNKEQIIEDIKIITADEKHSNKLFLCLDEKPPQEHKFSKLEEFLKGTSNLEEISGSLASLADEVEQLKKEISESISRLKETAFSIKSVNITN